MSPQNVLKRGYSITLLNGKAVKSFENVKANDPLETIVFDGKIHSIVKSSQKPE
jgi:exodeoxyribonuclease VII large subunit